MKHKNLVSSKSTKSSNFQSKKITKPTFRVLVLCEIEFDRVFDTLTY